MRHILKKIHSIAFHILILISLSDCRKKYEDPPTENLGFISMGEAKDYLLFKPGTWWVYKNTYTNELDTMNLTTSVLDTIQIENRNPPSTPRKRIYSFEYITFDIQSLRDSANYHTYLSGMDPDAEDFFILFEFVCQRNGGFYNIKHTGYSYATQFSYPFYTSEHKGASGAMFIERKDSMVVMGKTYYDIVSFSVNGGGSMPYPNIFIFDGGNSIYYWARYIGVIKMEHQCYDKNFKEIQMNWELIESHIYK